MIDEPDIAKQLMEAERLGMLQSKAQSTYEKLQVLEEPLEDVPDEISGVCERDVEKKTRNDNTDYEMAEETLRESEKKFRTIFERANDTIILLDKSGRVLDVSSGLGKGTTFYFTLKNSIEKNKKILYNN